MEKVYSNVQFPCRYQKEGCSITTTNIEVHENKCKYNSTRPCPLEFNSCDWRGSYAGMGAHIVEKHNDLILRNVKDLLTASLESLLLCKNNEQYFKFRGMGMLRILTTNEKATLKIVVQYVGYYKDAMHYCKFKIFGPGTKKMLLAAKCQPLAGAANAFSKGFVIPHTHLRQFSKLSACRMYIYL